MTDPNPRPAPSRRRVFLIRAGIIFFLLLAILMGFDRAMRPPQSANVNAPGAAGR